MARNDFIAKAETTINSRVQKVWNALTDPSKIKKYMFGTTVTSDWKEGSSITWKGEYEGKKYEDKGKILKIKPGKQLQYSHYSPLSGVEDKPENYHIVTIDLQERGEKTEVRLSQDNNGSEKEKQHSEKNWQMMLDGLRKLSEDPRPPST